MCWVLNPPMPPTKCNLSDRQMVGELTIGMALITQIGKEVGFNTKYCQVLAHTHRKPRPAASLRYTKNYFPLFLSPFATPGEREPNLILFWKWSPVSCWMSHQRQAAHIPSTRPKMLPRFFSIFNSCRNQKKINFHIPPQLVPLILQPRELLGIKTLMSTWLQGLVHTSGEASIKPESATGW